MANYLLADIDNSFWRRVKAKAALEGQTVKGVILTLLTLWLDTKTVTNDPKTPARKEARTA